MDANLQPVTAALAELEDRELHALVATVNGMPQLAPGLLAWIEHIADWEINRRTGLEFPLQPPEAAIPPEEDERSIAAATMMRKKIADAQDESGSLVPLFHAIVGALTGHQSLQ